MFGLDGWNGRLPLWTQQWCHTQEENISDRQDPFFVENLYKNNVKMFAHTWTHTFKVLQSLFIPKSLQNKSKYVQIVINCILYTHTHTQHDMTCLSLSDESTFKILILLSWIVTLIIKLTCHFSWCSRYSDSPHKCYNSVAQ